MDCYFIAYLPWLFQYDYMVFQFWLFRNLRHLIYYEPHFSGFITNIFSIGLGPITYVYNDEAFSCHFHDQRANLAIGMNQLMRIFHHRLDILLTIPNW